MNKKMKKVLTVMFLIISLGVTSMMGFADVTLVKEKIFDVTINGDEFIITFKENPSTGYTWNGVIGDDLTNMVQYISEEYLPSTSDLIGATGTRSFTYKVNNDGVSTILFTNSRSWESGNIEKVDVLVYMNNGKLIVEENAIAYVTTVDSTEIELFINTNDSIIVDVVLVEEFKLDDIIIMKDGHMIESEVSIQEINNVTMIPLRATLEAAGFTVKWNEENRSIDISKGAQFTTIYIDKNSYFKNKMAPSELSAAPIILNNRTLVPAEFFTEILNINVSVSKGSFTLLDSEIVINSGYVNEIKKDSDGNISITISTDKDSEDRNTFTVINTLKDVTIFNKEFEVGDYVNVICSLMSTRSIPPQTPGYIIY